MYHAQFIRGSTTEIRLPSWQKLGHLIPQGILPSRRRELGPVIGSMTVRLADWICASPRRRTAYRWVLEASGSPINSKKLS
jgi:hypothetical protein